MIDYRKILEKAVKKINLKYPGVKLAGETGIWSLIIPDEYKIGPEAHFGQVTKMYLQYLIEGDLPDWEVPNMIAKYYTTTQAFEMAMIQDK